MAKKLFAIFFSFIPFFMKAQYTEIINSNRPGFSESPYSVGTGVYQLESSLFFRKASAIPTFSNPQALGLNLHFRTTFLLEKLELNVNSSFQQDKFAFKNVFESSYDKIGLGALTLGGKYLVFEPKYTEKGKEIRSWNKRHSFDFKRWIPNVAVYAGVNFGSVLSDYHNRGGITPKAGILLQNNFSKQFNLVTNVYYDYIGGELPEISYIITGTYNFNGTWVGFAEHQALFNAQEKQSNVGGGLAYLYTNDLQLNSSVRATFQESGIGYYVSLGASYRLDRHVDKFIELDEFGNKIEDEDNEVYNKGFFGRLFEKIKGIFKKKDKQVEVDTEEGEKKEGEETPTTGRKRQKSILDDIIKKDKKGKKAKTKADKKASKKEKKAKEKERKRLEKEQRKEEKRAQKELEKLEKEQRKEDRRKQKELEKLEKEVKRLEKEKAIEDEIDRRFREDQKKREQRKKEKEEKEKEKKNNKEEG